MKTGINSIKQLFKRHRIPTLIIGLSILLLGSYIIWSKYAWDTYQLRSTAWSRNMQTKLDAALAMKDETEEERKNKLKMLESTSRAIARDQDATCRPDSFIGWQRLFEPLGKREEECSKLQGKLRRLGEALDKVIGYLKAEHALAGILARAPHTAELVESTWEAQASAWHALFDQVSRLPVPEVFEPTKQAAIDTTENIDAAWQRVMVAHKAQERAKYQEAQAALVQAYAGTGAITDVDTKQLEALLKTLALAYEEAF